MMNNIVMSVRDREAVYARCDALGEACSGVRRAIEALRDHEEEIGADDLLLLRDVAADLDRARSAADAAAQMLDAMDDEDLAREHRRATL